MGTTVVAVGLAESDDGLLPVVVNVGDSRAYQLRDGAMRQITADHSVAEEWVRQGRLTSEEANDVVAQVQTAVSHWATVAREYVLSS